MMNAQYFINKFKVIPEQEWTTGTQQDGLGRRCAFGHCMPREEISAGSMDTTGYGHETPEGVILKEIFIKHFKYSDSVAAINNCGWGKYQQDTPKQRILAALNDILLLEEQEKALEQAKELLRTDELIELAVDS